MQEKPFVANLGRGKWRFLSKKILKGSNRYGTIKGEDSVTERRKGMKAEEVLKIMIGTFLAALEDIVELTESEDERNVFYGMKTVYVESLEIIQRWDLATAYGLNFNIEDKYPV